MLHKIARPFYVVAALFAAIFLAMFLFGAFAIRRAEDAFSARRYAAAAQSFEQAANIFFWRNELWERAGLASALNEDPQKAIEYLQRTSVLSEDGWIVLAESHLSLGNPDAGIQTIEQGLREYPSPKLTSLLASTHRRQKNWNAERDALQNQLALDSKQEDAYTYYRLGLLLAVLDPHQSPPHLLRASALDPETDSAAQTLIFALNVSDTLPDESQRKVTIGRALGLVNEWDLSIAAFEDAIESDAENAEAWAWLGEAKQQIALSASKGEGSVELDRALLLDHTSVTVRALRGLYWRRQEEYPQMLAEYLLAAEYDPQNPAWQVEIGNAHLKLGDLVSALAAFQYATELAPTDPTYWSLLGMFCAENSVHLEDIGLPAAEKAAQLAPDDPSALDSLGWVYLSSGRYANAEKILSDASNRFPGFLSAHIHLAMTYLAQGNRSAARNKLLYVLNADRDGVYGKEAGRLLQQYFP
ncbi:MAG: tetratricopeptide repeat protein [Chloroflexi bacterium]|nr:tetratricopeptide repeat protein [Chloroflexota bacterium]